MLDQSKRAVGSRMPLWAVLFLGTLLATAAHVWAGDNAFVPTVSVTGRAVLDLPPDQAQVVLGVRTRAASAEQAARQNAAVMEKVLDEVKRRLGPRDNLRTLGYRVGPRSEWDQASRRPRDLGYEAVNQVGLLLRDTSALGAILDAATAAGANLAQGPVWSLAQPGQAQRQAQVQALADARAQAQDLAEAAGMSLGPVRGMDTDGGDGPRPQAMALRANAAQAEATPLEPGTLEVEATVHCVFSLLPKP